MKISWIYAILLTACFAVGMYSWRVVNSGRSPARDLVISYDQKVSQAQGTLVYVGDVAITYDEIDFEYSLHTKGIFDSDELEPAADFGSRYEEELTLLKQRLLSTVIERKLLFLFAEQDKNFDITNPARFTECMEEWQKAIKESEAFFDHDSARERLKTRLCEKSVIKQYLVERIFPRIVISDEEIAAYYKDHEAEFIVPEQVVIRNIVVGTEREARQIRNRVRRNTFADVAKEVSLTPESSEGGRLGPFARGEMPSVFDVAFHMRVGEVRGVLRSNYGFHIILLEEKSGRKVLNLEEASPRIHETLAAQRQEQEYQQWVELALSSIEVRPPRPAL